MARRPPPPIDGLCVVDKPAGWTSHDVVAKSRGVLGTRKVGHSGTLDPDATGVLLLGVGRATRLLRYLTDLGKSYVGEVVFGAETTTLDAAGEITAEYDMAGLTLEAVQAAAAPFRGRIEQVPPMVSAVKVGGRRLHELAREGIEVERAARPVTIHRLEVAETVDSGAERPVFRVEVTCSSGTYIRTLAADLGAALGGGAHLRNLRRTAVGSFTLAEARPLEALELLPIETCLRDYGSVRLDDAHAARVAHGNRIPIEVAGLSSADLDAAPHATPDDPTGSASGPGPWAAFAPDGRLVAVLERRNDREVQPAVVLLRPEELAGGVP